MSTRSMVTVSRRSVLTGAVLSVLVLAGLSSRGVGADSTSRAVNGTLTSQSFSGAGCASPIDLCATGVIRGGLNGSFEFYATQLIPSEAPGVLFMTGVTTIHDIHGDVRCNDSAALNTAPGDGELIGLCEIVGLTGTWEGASGYLQSFGTFNAATGGAEQYTGKVVRH